MHLDQDLTRPGLGLGDIHHLDAGGTGEPENLDRSHGSMVPVTAEPRAHRVRPMDMRLLVAITLGLVLTACGHSSSSPHSVLPSISSGVAPACCASRHDARVDLALVGIGGVAASLTQHWAGTIHVAGGRYTTARTDRRGHAHLALPAGRYTFTATSPSYDGGRGECRALRPVRLLAHRTTHVRVICQLK
jgi:hypothetical protein